MMPGGFTDAVSAVVQPEALLMLIFGILLGALIGFIPGLSGVTGLAIFLPFTIVMDPFEALMFFAGLGGAPRVTGAVTSIVLNIPGSPVNAATAFDGYPMARRGEARRALAIAAMASLLGTLFGLGVLLLAMPLVFTLLNVIGPAELFALSVLALATISFSSTNTLQGFIRGLASGGVGILISFIGVATVTGQPRFNFGSDGYLFDGIQLVPLFIGVFAVAQVIRFAIDRDPAVSAAPKKGGPSGVGQGIRDTFNHWQILLRGSTIGAAIGVMPGVGGTAANFLSYSWTKASSKDPDRYGKGAPEGVVATESANNAEHSASIVPTLGFGIPGGAEGALILGLLTLQGFVTGPLLLTNHPDVLWVLVIGTVLSVGVVSALALVSTGLLAKVALLPLRYLVPGVLIFALLGTYIADTNAWDLVFAIGIGLLAFWFIQSGFSPAALVIGYVLGPLAENSFVLSYQSGGGYGALFTSPAALVIWVATVILVGLATRSAWRARKKRLLSGSYHDAMVPPSEEEEARSRPSWSAFVFTLAALALAAYVLLAAGELPSQVGLVPTVLGWVTAGLLVFSALLELRRLAARGWELRPPAVPGWSLFVVVWVAVYGAAIIFLGLTLASVLASAAYIAVEGRGKVPARSLMVQSAAFAGGLAVVLMVLNAFSFGGFGGLFFGESLSAW